MRKKYIHTPSENFGKFKIITNRKSKETFYIKIEDEEIEEFDDYLEDELEEE